MPAFGSNQNLLGDLVQDGAVTQLLIANYILSSSCNRDTSWWFLVRKRCSSRRSSLLVILVVLFFLTTQSSVVWASVGDRLGECFPLFSYDESLLGMLVFLYSVQS